MARCSEMRGFGQIPRRACGGGAGRPQGALATRRDAFFKQRQQAKFRIILLDLSSQRRYASHHIAPSPARARLARNVGRICRLCGEGIVERSQGDPQRCSDLTMKGIFKHTGQANQGCAVGLACFVLIYPIKRKGFFIFCFEPEENYLIKDA